MQTLALHFDFSKDPPADDPDLSHFRLELSRRLEAAMKTTGPGRWRGGRYVRGIVTLFFQVPDIQKALKQVHSVITATALADRMAIDDGSVSCRSSNGELVRIGVFSQTSR